MLESHCQVLLKYLFQLQEFCNCRSVILNKKEKCWNDSSLTEERHPGRNDDSLLGELQLELHVYSVSISCLLIKCCYAIYMHICL